MGAISEAELSKISYLDPEVLHGRNLDGREIMIMPFWDGVAWHLWVEALAGSITKMRVVDAARSHYVAKKPAGEADICIEFVERIWQQASWPKVSRTILRVVDDFHLLATSAAKLHHFFAARDNIDNALISSFVTTELEYIITVARSVFDLLQEAVAAIWNDQIDLRDPAQQAIKNRHKLLNTFTQTALVKGSAARPAAELMAKYAISSALAEQYHRVAPFYLSLLKSRDNIIHYGGSVGTVFVTEKGFCVDPSAKTFTDFEWKPEHNYNEKLVSLLPWIAHIICGTIQACNDVMGAFISDLSMPAEIAPGYSIFIRDPANRALIQLLNTANGSRVWWSDPI